MTNTTTFTVTKTTDSGKGSLRNAIEQAKSGDLIKFKLADNSTINLTSGELEIEAGKKLTIDGSNVSNLTISGNNSSRIFNITSRGYKPSGLNIKNLTLAKGKSKDLGGAINIEGLGGNLDIDNVNFYDNVAKNGGGAIYVGYDASTLNIKDSSFKKNIATAGNNERGGGAISFKGPQALKVKNTEFIQNLGINGGAINSLQGKLLIENCQFIKNSTTAAHFDKGKFNPFLRGHGGAIFTDRASSPNEGKGYITIINSVFEGNQAEGQGGAASLYTTKQDKVIIQGSTFNDNHVTEQKGGNPGNGGAVVQMNDTPNRGFIIKDSTFSNNTSTHQGGAVWKNYAPTTIINTTFYNNTAENPNDPNDKGAVGGGLSLQGSASITNSTFSENHAGWVGGAICGDTKRVNVRNTIFYKNTADNGTNDWKIKDTTNFQFQGGNNIQFPDLESNKSNRYNDNYATTGIIIIDPKLGPLKNNGGLTETQALLPDSPAIDAGTNAGIPDTDQRGRVRRADSDGNGTAIADIGAYEVAPNSATQSIISGISTNNQLNGTSKNEILNGSGGNDTLIGGLGNDTLVGGSGSDRFSFSSVEQKIDTIADFQAGEDAIEIKNSGFGSQFVTNSHIMSDQLVIGTGANKSETQFIYNQNNGNLYFDSDGTGSLAATHFATLTNKSFITNNDIFIIS